MVLVISRAHFQAWVLQQTKFSQICHSGDLRAKNKPRVGQGIVRVGTADEKVLGIQL